MIRSLLKIVKSSQVISDSTPVPIDNTVRIPPPPPKPKSKSKEPTPEELVNLERERAEEEKKKLLAEMDSKIEAEVDVRVSSMLGGIENKRQEILYTANRAKFEILSEASVEAENILLDTKEEADRLRQEAREQGHAEGFEAGKAEAAAQCEKYIQAAAQFLSGINAKKEGYFLSHEEALRETLLDMVKKITLGELKTDSEAIFRILKQAAKTFRNSDYLKITFSALDVKQELVSDMDFIRSVVGNIPEIEVEVLPDAEEGTLIVDNGSELIDASVPTQLEFLKEILDNSKK